MIDRPRRAAMGVALTGAMGLMALCFLLPLPASGSPTPAPPTGLLFIGRFHPILLHLPIGLLAFGAILRGLSLLALGKSLRPALTLCVWLSAGAATVTAATGWLLAQEGGYHGATFDLHWKFGLGIAGLALLLLALHHAQFRGAARAQGVVWLVTLGCLGFGAHQGGSLSHGDNFLAEYAPDFLKPWLGPAGGKKKAEAGEKTAETAADPDFTASMAIFERYCTDCHGAAKAKGEQRLHTPEDIARGGKSGASVVPGQPEKSLVLARLLLAENDKKHMPPEGKAQPEAQEIDTLRRWITAGAPGLPKKDRPETAGDTEKSPPEAQSTARARRLESVKPSASQQSTNSPETMNPKKITATATLLAAAFTASADSPADPKGVAEAMHRLVEARCAECHDQAGHGKSKGSFGFVLDFARLRADPAYVNTQAPEASAIYTRLIDGDPESRMPQLTKAEKDKGLADPVPLTGEEKALALNWLQLGAPTPDGKGAHEIAHKPAPDNGKPNSSVPAPPAPVAKRTIITEPDAVQELGRDLRAQPTQDRAQVRYISILPQYNNTSEVSDAQLDVIRNGVRKLLNSLSTNPKVATFAEVGPGKAFFRFKLEDLGWTAALWDRIVSFYPYAMEESDLGATAGTPVPVLRADWLATNGARPPLYHEILGLPATLDELNRKLGVDLVGDLQKFRALRAGFTSSGISRFNRMIERHDLGSWPGYYWLSYDCAGSDLLRDLLRNPLGPVSAHIASSKHAFQHDGGELIFSLPNGFQAYYLVNSAGKRLDIAPTSIVGDIGGVTGRPDVVNGLSCILCHSGGMKEQPGNKDSVTDQVRGLAGHGGFSAEEEEAILALFKEQKEIDSSIAADRAAYKAALAKAGITQGSVEPIGSLSLAFEERLTTARAAAELGLSAAALEGKLADHDNFGIVRIQLGQRALPRDVFGDQFADLARRLGIGQVRPAAAVLGGTVDVLRAAQEKKRPQPLLFELRTDKSVYCKGEPVNITIFSQQEGHLRLFYKDAAGAVTTLFPSAQLEKEAKKRGSTFNDRIPGGQPVLISGRQSVTNITVFIEGPKFGREQLGAVMTDFPLEDDAEFRAELERSGSIEVAVSSIAAKSARIQVNGEKRNPAAAKPKLGVQIVDLLTVEK